MLEEVASCTKGEYSSLSGCIVALKPTGRNDIYLNKVCKITRSRVDRLLSLLSHNLKGNNKETVGKLMSFDFLSSLFITSNT